MADGPLVKALKDTGTGLAAFAFLLLSVAVALTPIWIPAFVLYWIVRLAVSHSGGG